MLDVMIINPSGRQRIYQGLSNEYAAVETPIINVIGNYIFGLPDDNDETMQQTLDLSMELNCEMANFYSAMAYPGSQLFQTAIYNKLELPKSWVGYLQHAFESLPLPTKYISAVEVLGFRDHAFNKYFTNRNYLAKIQQKFGQETFEHIVDMTKYNLKRQHAVYVL